MFKHFATGSVFPHVFSRVDPIDKYNYREKYREIKKYGTSAALAGVVTVEGTQLVKDIISSKLKAYGYKSLFAIASGPVVRVVALPFYAFTYGSKLRRFALSVNEVGVYITKGQMGVVNWAWVGLDIVLFGELVPINNGYIPFAEPKVVGNLVELID